MIDDVNCHATVLEVPKQAEIESNAKDKGVFFVPILVLKMNCDVISQAIINTYGGQDQDQVRYVPPAIEKKRGYYQPCVCNPLA